jgi:DNA-binding FadR family transcriptional regulator
MTLLKTTREPLSEQVFQWLLAEIQSGRWSVGTKLPAEAQLMVESGVCRSTLREAVRGLIHAGILEARHGSGTYVVSTTGIEAALRRRLDSAKAFEIMEVRRALEVQAAGLAAARRTPEEVEALTALLTRLHEVEEARDLQAFVELDLAFLLAVVRSSRNRLLTDLYQDLEAPLRELFAATVPLAVFHPLQRAIHRPLMAAIRAGDARAAEDAARAHLDRVIAIFEAGGVL